MAKVGSIIVDMVLNLAGLRKGAAAVEAEMKRVNQRAGAVTASGFIDALKRTVGGRSTLKDFIEIGRGAGPIAGVALAVKTLGSAAQAAAGSVEELRNNTDGFVGAAGNFLDRLPIIGSFREQWWGAIDSLSGAEADEIRLLKWRLADAEAARKQADAYRNLKGAIEDNRLANERALMESNMGKMTPAQQEVQAAANAGAEELRKLDERFAKIRAGVDEERRGQVDRQHGQQILDLEERNQRKIADIRARYRQLDEEAEREKQERLRESELRMRARRIGEIQSQIDSLAGRAAEKLSPSDNTRRFAFRVPGEQRGDGVAREQIDVLKQSRDALIALRDKFIDGDRLVVWSLED